MVSTTADVQPGKVAAALRAAGLTEIDTATRRRAEYSSDASNYRVVPAVVAFPGHADEIVAALAVCRELGVPIVARGGGHLDRGQRAVHRRRARPLAAPQPGAVASTRGADRGGRARDRSRLDHRGRRAARAALRARPVHALARAPSAARSATTPAARGRCATGAPPTTWSRWTSSPAAARGSPRAGSGVTPATPGPGRPGAAAGPGGPDACSPRCAPWSAATWPRSGPSSAGSPGRCPATPWSTCCRRTGPTSRSSSSGTEGTLALTLRRHRPPGRRAARHRARRARLPGHGRRRRGGARAAAAPAGRPRGP